MDVLIIITIRILTEESLALEILFIFQFASYLYCYNDKNVHSNLSYLDNVTLVCIISNKLRAGINTPFFSCGQEYLHLPVVYGMLYIFLPGDYGMV